MAKFARIEAETPDSEEFIFDCPGCGCAHWVRVQGPNPCWTWNGDVNRPTLSPSLNVQPGTNQQCHSFISDGRIQFLADCWHELKGQTVKIPEWNN